MIFPDILAPYTRQSDKNPFPPFVRIPAHLLNIRHQSLIHFRVNHGNKRRPERSTELIRSPYAYAQASSVRGDGFMRRLCRMELSSRFRRKGASLFVFLQTGFGKSKNVNVIRK